MRSISNEGEMGLKPAGGGLETVNALYFKGFKFLMNAFAVFWQISAIFFKL